MNPGPIPRSLRCHCGNFWQEARGQPSCAFVNGERVLDRLRLGHRALPAGGVERGLDQRRNASETEPAGDEFAHCNLVSRVEHGRGGPARCECAARKRQGGEADQIRATQARLVEEAQRVLVEDIAINEAMGRHGAELLQDATTVLTHCNAGALATGGYGTALGVIRAAVAAGKNIRVFADETRPFLQGARLTAWELGKDGIPVTLITDNMAGHFMHQGKIQAAIVGC